MSGNIGDIGSISADEVGCIVKDIRFLKGNRPSDLTIGDCVQTVEEYEPSLSMGEVEGIADVLFARW